MMPRQVTTIITNGYFFQQTIDWDIRPDDAPPAGAIAPATGDANSVELNPDEETPSTDQSTVEVPIWPAPMPILYPALLLPILPISSPTYPPPPGWPAGWVHVPTDLASADGMMTSAGSDANTPSNEGAPAESDGQEDETIERGEWRVGESGEWEWFGEEEQVEVRTEWGWGDWEARSDEPAPDDGPPGPWMPWWTR